MSEKAYTRSYNSLQNGLGVKWVTVFIMFYGPFLCLCCDSVDADNQLGGAGTSWTLENWQFSLGVLGSFLL